MYHFIIEMFIENLLNESKMKYKWKCHFAEGFMSLTEGFMFMNLSLSSFRPNSNVGLRPN